MTVQQGRIDSLPEEPHHAELNVNVETCAHSLEIEARCEPLYSRAGQSLADDFTR